MTFVVVEAHISRYFAFFSNCIAQLNEVLWTKMSFVSPEYKCNIIVNSQFYSNNYISEIKCLIMKTKVS